MEYKTPEQRKLEKDIAYNQACALQYRDAASRMEAYPKLHQRAIDNVVFHERKLAYLQRNN